MGKLIKLEVVNLPTLYLVGKELKINMEEHMKGNNRIPAFWDTCFSDGTFSTLEQQADFIYNPAYVGVMMDWDKGDGYFTYICGILMKEGVTAPDGFAMHVLPPTDAAVSWIQGKDVSDVCAKAHEQTEQALKEAGYNCDGIQWCMELYNCPRFTTPNENGEIILDYYIPCKKA